MKTETIILNKKQNYIERLFEMGFIVIALWLLARWQFPSYFSFSKEILTAIDWSISIFLMLELIILFVISSDKKQYFANNWLTILVALLFFSFLIWFHTSATLYLRFLRIFVFMKIFSKSFKFLKEIILFNHIGTTLIIAILLTVMCGIAMSHIDPAINTVGNGIWWAWETITTVGYGDEAPSTVGGRLLAIVVMIFGAALFSIITANLSAFIISKRKNIEDDFSRHQQIIETLSHLKEKLESVEAKLEDIKRKEL